MQKNKSKLQKIKEYLKKNRNQLIGTAAIFLLAIAVMWIPYFSTQENSDSLQDELSTLFEKYEISSYEEAKALLKRKSYDEEALYSEEKNTVYVWNSVSNLVYNVSQDSISLSPAYTSFDYEGNVCLGYSYKGMPSYVVAGPKSMTDDLFSIYHSAPDETLTFSSQGVFAEFIDFVYQRTLFLKQSQGGFSLYRKGEEVTSDDFRDVRLSILDQIDVTEMSGNLLEHNLSLAQSALSPSLEIVIRDNVKALDARLFGNAKNLRRYYVESPAYRLESDALIDNKKQELLSFPAKSDRKEVVVPKEILSIAEGAFFGCEITSITLPFVGLQRNTSFPPLGLFGVIFGKTANGYDQIVGDSFVSYAIPSTLKKVVITDETVLCRGAFSGCTQVESIVLNEGILSIEDYAFDRCNALKELAIPASVQFMEMGEDNGLASLKTLILPDHLSLPFAESFPNRRRENGMTVYTR